MGYYTKYDLDMEKKNRWKSLPSEEEVLKILAPTIGTDFDEENPYFDVFFEEPMKWYSYDRDMKMVSSLYPGIVFALTGWGEEQDDIWVNYYLDGNSYFHGVEIKFPSFEEVIERVEPNRN